MGVFKKNGNWWIDFYHQGKRIRRKVGPSKKLAEQVLADVQVKKAKQEFLGICEPKKILFRDFAKEYLEYAKANKAKSSHKRDRSIVNCHLIPAFGEMALTQVTPKMIEDYKARRMAKGAHRTVNRELTILKNLFRKAVEWGYARENPTNTVKFLKESDGPFRFLSREEGDLLLDACKKNPRAPHLYLCVALALHTGMRRGEIFRLRWEDVDLKAGRIRVVSREDAHTKNYESRSIPMSELIRNALSRHPRRLDSPFVVCQTNGNPLRDIRNPFETAVRKAGIPSLRFHDLRHTFASWLVMAGVDIRTVQELLGHKDIRITMRYAHLAPDHMSNAVKTLDGHHLDTGATSTEQGEAACAG